MNDAPRPDNEYGILIDGKPRKGGGPEPVRNPFDGKPVAMVWRATGEIMDAAIASAQKAFEKTRALTTYERESILEKIAAGLHSRAEQIARTIVAEAGKPIALARGEVERGINTFAIAAREVHRIEGETMPLDVTAAGKGRFGLTRRFPLGTVAAITPFNFPLNLVAHKVAAAIAVGSTLRATRRPSFVSSAT